MNYIKHSMAAHEHLLSCPASKPHHVSLYFALFRQWNLERFPEALLIDRRELMQAARIGSRDTYTSALRDLQAWGLLTYRPSHDSTQGTRVLMTELGGQVGPKAGQPHPVGMPESGPTPEAEVSPDSGQPVSPELGQPGSEVSPKVSQPSLLDKTGGSKQLPKQGGGGMKKKEGQVFPGEGLSRAEVMPDELPTTGAAEAPKEKVAPKRKGVKQATIRAAATAQTNEPRRQRGRAQRPEVPFAESKLADVEQFIKAFEGTDYQLADLRFYHAQVTNWRKDGEPPRRRDWKATATKFMLNDAHDNRLKLAPTVQRHEPGTSSSTVDPGGPASGYRSSRWD
ncbi:hypothetical protein EJV47_04690 [Hymenobacter gummosus]|uniref:Uncharacterized protein n=1 Tax=Hymenobacter gummosus TaxID=1776032 RepID=A0A431U752_9BACT|nr:hypothetical protein [Hymenobacter gummosus]RTQ52323.1 hypothetical protein EJV47_04690 [Hymenobacter gummosus]